MQTKHLLVWHIMRLSYKQLDETTLQPNWSARMRWIADVQAAIDGLSA